MKNLINKSQIQKDFWGAPENTLFTQSETTCIVPFSDAWFERLRVVGGGIKYTKIGRRVFYRKKDILEFIEKQEVLSSTSEQAIGGFHA